MLYDEILILCGKSGISIARLERETELGNGTIRRWKHGNPTAENLHRVAKYFGVSINTLMGSCDYSVSTVQ